MTAPYFAFLAGRDGSPKTHYYEYFEDFTRTYQALNYVLTTTEDGSGSATEAIAAGDPPSLLITNAAGANDYDAFQVSSDGGTTALLGFALTAGKRLYFGARFKLGDADSSNIVIGLHDADTDPVGNTISEGIYFDKGEDGDLDITVVDASTETRKTAVHTMVDDTYVDIEFIYNGLVDEDGAIDGMIEFYVDGVHVWSTDVANAPTDDNLAVSWCIENGAAAAETMNLQWVRAVRER